MREQLVTVGSARIGTPRALSLGVKTGAVGVCNKIGCAAQGSWRPVLVLSAACEEIRVPLPILVCNRHVEPMIIARMLRPAVLRNVEDALRRRRVQMPEVSRARVEYERSS